ncbi:MAG: hypothetical protein HZA16_15385 [Nitrospirae bacterium]|nr:hypothetical protein [Nitrospirota bacterium]
MGNDFDRELSQKYCQRFAKIAIDRGFISSEQAKSALSEQMDDDISNRPHRLIGRILLEKNWITPPQIETILNDLFDKKG